MKRNLRLIKPKRKPPILTNRTQDLLNHVQARIGMPILVYWLSTGGSICQNDVTAMSAMLGAAKRARRVGLFLKSDGGNPEAALRFVHLLRQKFEHISLLAPFECASAATMVALGANEIQMGATSYLTAVDSSFKHDLSPVDHHNYLVSVSQDEVMRILRLWKEQRSGGNPSRKSISTCTRWCSAPWIDQARSRCESVRSCSATTLNPEPKPCGLVVRLITLTHRIRIRLPRGRRGAWV